MVRKVLEYPHEALKIPCDTEITEMSQGLHDLLLDMEDTMYEHGGLGLAANQIGVHVRVFVMDTEYQEFPDEARAKRPRAFINPKILATNELVIVEEGCLSLPGAFVKNKRFDSITLGFMDTNLKYNEETFTGLTALAVQHEMDHLDGKLFIDRMKLGDRMLALKKFKDHKNKRTKPNR